MPTLCFDPIGGASGDMILGALFDLGADVAAVDAALRSTGLDGFAIDFERRQDANQIVCGFCDVRDLSAHHHGHDASREHDGSPGERGHRHPHPHTDSDTGHDASTGNDGPPGKRGHRHHHRSLGEILAMIEGGEFADRAKERAVAVFTRLAEAEGAVHGIPPENVHFHEVGAVDSIVDIVGACVALELLQVDTILCSQLKVGHGTVKCAHGVLPVPAPATCKLIEGHAVKRLDVPCELTTPTGAALLTTLSSGSWNDLPLNIIKIGAGHGTRVHQNVPNMIRAMLCEQEIGSQVLTMLEADIDDDTPERLAYVADRLRCNGALDVTLLPVQMKKGRPGQRVNVLVEKASEQTAVRLLLDESSTIGVRSHAVRRYALPRRAGVVSTPWGEVKVKIIDRPWGAEAVPEFEDCRRLAETTAVPLRRIMIAAGSTSSVVSGPGQESTRVQ